MSGAVAAARRPRAAVPRARRSPLSVLLALGAALIAYLTGARFLAQDVAELPRLGLAWLRAQLTDRTDPASPAASPADPDRAPASARSAGGCLLAFADIHADLQQAQRVLHLVGATDQNGDWAAGTCTLVQTGDLVDRGADSIAVLKLFDRVSEQAAEAGGKVVQIMGNHEMESIQGDFKDINKRELARIGEEALSRATLSELLSAVPRHYRNMIDVFFRGSQVERAGVAAWAAAMAPGSWLGDTMRDRQAAAIVGTGSCRTLFVHAGLDGQMLKLLDGLNRDKGFGLGPIDTLNRVIADEVANCDGSKPCPTKHSDSRVKQLFGENGPWWTRVYMNWSKPSARKQATELMSAVLHTIGASQVVVGHTIQMSPTVACDGKLYMMDVGMCRLILGKLAAWTCIDGKVSIVQP